MPRVEPRPTPRPGAGRVPVSQRLVKVGLAFVTCALLLNALVGARGLPALLDARREHEALERDLDQIRSENARLRAEVKRLREDPEAIGRLARERLHLIEDGEIEFIIRDVPPPDAHRPK